jgi:hypothetical protein
VRFLGQTAQLVAFSAARLRFPPYIIGKKEAQFVPNRGAGLLCRIPCRGHGYAEQGKREKQQKNGVSVHGGHALLV